MGVASLLGPLLLDLTPCLLNSCHVRYPESNKIIGQGGAAPANNYVSPTFLQCIDYGLKNDRCRQILSEHNYDETCT
jgi:hypothetical protein